MSRLLDCSETQQKKILDGALKILIDCDKQLAPPLIAEQIEKNIRLRAKCSDPYKHLKKLSNDISLKLYPQLTKLLYNAKNKLQTALKISAFGNLIDFATLEHSDLTKEIATFNKFKIRFRRFGEFSKKLSESKIILIVGDNAGEIVFDKILIEFLTSKYKNIKIYFAVKSGPVINDATIGDAEYTGLDKVCQVIESGLKIPGIALDRCSKVFLKVFNSADLILSKGQGNFESLSSVNDDRIYYLLKIKCDVVAKHIGGVEIGDAVLTDNAIRN